MLFPTYLTQLSARNAAGGDPYWANVVLLCGNDNAADASTTFVDQSASAHTLTATGNIQYDTAQAPTGMTSSILCDGTGDFLAIGTSADWAFGTGDFTVEFMIRKATGDHSMFGFNGAGAGAWLPLFFSGVLSWQVNPGVTNLYSRSSAAVEDSAWHHVSVCRSGTDNRMFFDGTQQGATVADSLDYSRQDAVAIFAWSAAGGFALNGHACCFRVTKGVARYTTDFTPPTLPMPTATT